MDIRIYIYTYISLFFIHPRYKSRTTSLSICDNQIPVLDGISLKISLYMSIYVIPDIYIVYGIYHLFFMIHMLRD